MKHLWRLGQTAAAAARHMLNNSTCLVKSLGFYWYHVIIIEKHCVSSYSLSPVTLCLHIITHLFPHLLGFLSGPSSRLLREGKTGNP